MRDEKIPRNLNGKPPGMPARSGSGVQQSPECDESGGCADVE